MLERVDTEAAIAMRQAESGNGHDSVKQLEDLIRGGESMRRTSGRDTYWSKHARHLLENVHVGQHRTGQGRSKLSGRLTVVELLPDNIAEVRQELVLLASMDSHLIQWAVVLIHG